MYGIFIIFLFYAAGNLISMLINEVIPGNVIGMLLLFVCLCCKVVNPEKVKPVSDFILRHMALYFVPVGVGLMVTTHYFSGAGVAIVVSMLVSTVLVLVVVGHLFQFIQKWKK
ncbi:CidA/LrgA family protein [Marinilabiliaceae bacterium ANBcel2]|nr:CidA/LrgA family protein [Marinilabiliaceae bacterium ANBcel2]